MNRDWTRMHVSNSVLLVMAVEVMGYLCRFISLIYLRSAGLLVQRC